MIQLLVHQIAKVLRNEFNNLIFDRKRCVTRDAEQIGFICVLVALVPVFDDQHVRVPRQLEPAQSEGALTR